MGWRAGRLAAAVGAVALVARPAAAQSAPLEGLDDYVTAAMEAWRVPGLALAVIADGEVVHARGYGVRDVRTGAPVDEHTLFAAGSTSKAFTSAALGLLVDEGRVSWDDRVIDHIPWFAMMAEMHRPQMLIQADAPENRLHPRDAPMNFNAYGLAWWIIDYRGRKVVDHGGGIDGMRAHVAFMPEEGLGMVALSNARPNNLIVALMYRVFDHFLGVGGGDKPDVGEAPDAGGAMADWSALMLAEYRESAAAQADAHSRREADRAAGTAPSRPLTEYAGSYGHEYYGAVDITHENGTLRFSLGGKTTGRLEHWHYDVFRAVPDNPANGEMFMTLTVGPDGVVGVLEVEGLGSFGRL